MKIFTKSVLAFAVVLAGACASCSDACDYTDSDTNNPSWINENYTDSTKITHPEAITGTTWVRGTGLKQDVYGHDIQGYVESIQFTEKDSCIVKMSAPSYVQSNYTFTNDSNTVSVPKYEYAYSEITGKVEILKMAKDEKGKVSKTTIFTGIAVSGTKEIMTIAHYGDIPVQTYLVKQ